MTSCASTARFPLSNIVPAAEITATKKHDKQNNYAIKITARNLAEASRLNPAKNNYSVWIVTDNGLTKNIGQLNNQNGKKASMKTVTAFNPTEIFITAEDSGNLDYPTGVEISRTTFSK